MSLRENFCFIQTGCDDMDLHCKEELPLSPDFWTTNKNFQTETIKLIPEIAKTTPSAPTEKIRREEKTKQIDMKERLKVVRKQEFPKDKMRSDEKAKKNTEIKESSKTGNVKKKKNRPLKPKLVSDCIENEKNGMRWSPSFKVTRTQLDALKDFFSLKPYPSSEQRKIIAKSLGLSADYVKGWFSRERRKFKSGKADYSNLLNLETATEENEEHSKILFYGSEDMEDLPYEFDDFTGLEYNHESVRDYSDIIYNSPDTDLLIGSAVLDSFSEDSDAMQALHTPEVTTDCVPKFSLSTQDPPEVSSECVSKFSLGTRVSQQNVISFGSIGFAKHFKNQHICEEDTVALTIPCDPYCHDNNQNWFDDLLLAEGELRVDTYHFKSDAFINNDDIEFTTNLKHLEYISEHL